MYILANNPSGNYLDPETSMPRVANAATRAWVGIRNTSNPAGSHLRLGSSGGATQLTHNAKQASLGWLAVNSNPRDPTGQPWSWPKLSLLPVVGFGLAQLKLSRYRVVTTVS